MPLKKKNPVSLTALITGYVRNGIIIFSSLSLNHIALYNHLQIKNYIYMCVYVSNLETKANVMRFLLGLQIIKHNFPKNYWFFWRVFKRPYVCAVVHGSLKHSDLWYFLGVGYNAISKNMLTKPKLKNRTTEEQQGKEKEQDPAAFFFFFLLLLFLIIGSE